MQALILAGGEGTRLRPLTSDVPKPVVPLVDRPFIAFMLDWLRGHGVDDVVMSLGNLGNGVYGHVSHGYWKDIGTPERYLEATYDILEGSVATEVQQRLGASYLCV